MRKYRGRSAIKLELKKMVSLAKTLTSDNSDINGCQVNVWDWRVIPLSDSHTIRSYQATLPRWKVSPTQVPLWGNVAHRRELHLGAYGFLLSAANRSLTLQA